MEEIRKWREVKTEQVKKKHKLFFFADRIIKIYDNDYFAYFTPRLKELKAVFSPKEMREAVLEVKDKVMKLTTMKNKCYIFKF